MSVPRHEYVLELRGSAASVSEDAAMRPPTRADAEALSRLMLDAYRGTIDDEGETVSEARDEVALYLEGGPPLEHSWLRIVEGVPVSACLVSLWAERDCPIVSYVMTARARKSGGLATVVLARSIASLVAAGHEDLRAVVTEGNLPSEALFRRAGFRRV